jgi:Predicted permease.
MGASIFSIFMLISKEIIVLVTISAAIAIPVAFYLANSWLQNYFYRINLGVLDFLLGFVAAIVVALATISYRTIKAAKANPVDSLLYE